MSISVRPDPDHPLGGYALLTVHGPVTPGPVMVGVTDLYEDRHLGPMGWQPAPVTMGPYAARDEDGALVVPVGPEIVDRIEAFTMLRLTVAGVSADLSWPDAVRTSPSRAGLGGLGVLSATDAAPASPREESAPTREPPPPPPPSPPPRTRSRLPMLIGLAALMVVLAGSAWWYLTQYGSERSEATIPPTPLAVGCDAAGLTEARALSPAEGFARVRACGAEGDPELRFQVIEAAADSGLAEAIAMIGRWYDPSQAEAVGSGFTSRDFAQAARYYKEAALGGYAPASELLAAACAALDPTTDPTHEIAGDLYCN